MPHPFPTPTFGPAEEACAEVLIELALDEDLDAGGGWSARNDVTSTACIPAEARGTAHVVARAPGVVAGLPILRLIAARFDDGLNVDFDVDDGQTVVADTRLATLRGSVRALLAAERTALNFLQRLSGIATLTATFVAETAGTRAAIVDTRKTTPGRRALDKYAVRCGGGVNHRVGLYDAVLIKDNHLAAIAASGDSNPIATAVRAAHALQVPIQFIEVEVDTLAQLDQALSCPPGPDIVLLDNMPIDHVAEAVRRRDRLAPKIQIEASGGVRLGDVAALAAAGVDRISVGALTHSAGALDIALDFESAPLLTGRPASTP